MSRSNQAEARVIAPESGVDAAAPVAVRRSLRMRLWDQTSVRQNLSSNLVTKALSALVSLACVPIYLRVLGLSGYGLIGVWTMLESLANLLDLGLSPTMTREMAAASTSVEAAHQARDLVRTLEVFYWAIGLLLGGAIILASPFLATHWLNSSQFSAHDLRNVIVLIGLLILCRWPLSFYGGGITGLERQVLLSWVSFAFVCARSFGAVLVLLWVSPTIMAFFWWQVAINLLNTAVLVALLWKCLPEGSAPRLRLETLRKIRKFAAGITAVAIVSMLLTDLDKLVVSKMLPLEEFGYYSLAWRMASMLYMVSGPAFAVWFPAFSRFVAAGDDARLAEAYHRGSQLMSVLVLPAAATMIFFAKPLIFAWTGNELTAEHTWLLAALLTAGTAFHCLVSIPYALQLAYGWTALAFYTNLVTTTVAVPLLIAATYKFGVDGAASIWLLITVGFMLVQLPMMHQRILRGELWAWYLRDSGFPALASFVVILPASLAFPSSAGRWSTFLYIGFITGLSCLFAACSVPVTRTRIARYFSYTLARSG
jgi:O-antigen/teichoic acid export membrane protein